MARISVFLPLLFFFHFANAQTTTTSMMDVAPALPSHWTVEGSLQAHSVAGNGSPWVGVGASYRVMTWADLGLRGYLPVARTVDQSSYSIQAFARARVARTRYTDFFIEPEYAQNYFDFIPFHSYGLALGCLSRVTPGIALGISGGLEITNVVIDSLGLEQNSGSYVYPKVAFLANFAF